MKTLLLVLALSSFAQAQITITLLGTGNPRPIMERFGPTTLVEAGGHRLLIDCGRGATIRLFDLDLLPKVDTVLFTHLHSDHVIGFPDFWLSGWIFGRKDPLHVRGPSGTRSMIQHLKQAYAFDVRMRRDIDERLPAGGVQIDTRDIDEGLIPGMPEGWRVTAFRVDHGPVKPALGYRIDYGGYSVVFSGDARPTENLVRFAKGADVVVHEVVALELERRRAKVPDPAAVERIIAHHTTAEDAGKIFARITPRLAVFSHIVPSVATDADVLPDARKFYDGRMILGEDRMVIRIGKDIDVVPH